MLVGRGLRHHRARVQARRGHLRRRQDSHVPGHGPRHPPGDAPERLRGQPERGRALLRRQLVLPAPHRVDGLHAGRRLRHGLLAVPPPALRRPALHGARVLHRVGPPALLQQRRRLLRPLDHRPHEARHEGGRGGPAAHVARGPRRRGLAARAPRRRRRAGHGHAEGRLRRAALRPGVLRQVGLRPGGRVRARGRDGPGRFVREGMGGQGGRAARRP